MLETWERWRSPVEALGIEFRAAEQYQVFPPPAPASREGASAAQAALALRPLLEEFRPRLVVNDILTLAPALAADLLGIPRVTLIPHVYPVTEPDMPFFALGMRPPRTIVGRALWRAATPIMETGLRQGRREWNDQRARLGLAPEPGLHGAQSRLLTLVATLPQLEYRQRWPGHVRVTGPMSFELEYPDVELPPGEEPLILVAPSTSQDPEGRLVRTAMRALAGEPVRVIATTNRVAPSRSIEVPANARLVDWLSYSQVMPQAALTICHGGHGTVARSLAAGVPILVTPAAGDMAETAARVGWAGLGAAIPWRLTRSSSLRWAVRHLLADAGARARAAEVARWCREHDGAVTGARLIEELGERLRISRT